MTPLVGCQTVEKSNGSSPIVAVGHRDLVRLAKSEFQRATAAFYRDDWDQVLVLVGRMKQVASRWDELQPPAGSEAVFREQTAGYGKSVADLESSATSKDVVKTTTALRSMAAHLGQLEKFP